MTESIGDEQSPGRPDAGAPPWGLGRVLRLATGVQENVLSAVPSERARYTSLGGVVAGTALMAMLSMAAALYFIFGGFQWFILLAVPVWGMFIFSLDRWLMSTITVGKGAAWRKLLPRLLLSIALGVVLAEPLLLGVYNTAIEERVAKDRQQELTDREGRLRTCNPVPGTGEAERPESKDPICAQYRLSLPGDSPDALQSQVDDLTAQQVSLKATVDADAKAYGNLEQKAREECNGDSGPGLTGRRGVGLNCNRLRAEADQYRADHRIDDNGKKLTELTNQINALNLRLGEARNTNAQDIDKAIEQDLGQIRARQGRIGILERFRTLEELVAEDGYVRATQWGIRIFFILVDALPVILKGLGGSTPYDKFLLGRIQDQERVERMRSGRELDRHKRYGEIVKREADMRFRVEVQRIDQRSRIELGNHDEWRAEVLDNLENHLLRTATGMNVPVYRPDEYSPPVVDAEFSNERTQELRTEHLSGGRS